MKVLRIGRSSRYFTQGKVYELCDYGRTLADNEVRRKPRLDRTDLWREIPPNDLRVFDSFDWTTLDWEKFNRDDAATMGPVYGLAEFHRDYVPESY